MVDIDDANDNAPFFNEAPYSIEFYEVSFPSLCFLSILKRFLS